MATASRRERQAGTPTVPVWYLWEPRFSGQFTTTFPAGAGGTYAVRATAEDAEGYTASRTVWYDATTGLCSDTGPHPRVTAWLPLGAGSVTVLAVIFVLRTLRHNRS